MIRLLGFLLLFAVGLAGAALWQGKMHHLRQAVPEQLPDWTGQITADAGVRKGQMALQDAPQMALEWTAKAPGAQGWMWDLRLVGRGVDLRAELLLPWWPTRAVLRGGDGAVDLAVASQGAVSGLVALQSVDGEVTDLTGARAISGTAAALARGVKIEGEALGEGPVALQLDTEGAWVGDVSLSGGLSAAKAQLRGALQDATATLDVTIEKADALPDQVQGVLRALGTQTADGLQIVLPVPLYN